MKLRFLSTVAAAFLCIALPANAATLSFDLAFVDAFADPLSVSPATVNGVFTYDTATAAFSGVEILGTFATYTSGEVLINSGFVPQNTLFVFTSGLNKFFFGLDFATAGLPPGQTVFSSVLALESANVDSDFVVDTQSPLFFGFGDVVVTQNADVAPVPLPAALPLLAAGLGAMGFVGWRKKRKTHVAA